MGFAVRNASKEWFKQVVTEISENPLIPAGVKAQSAWKLVYKAATKSFDTGSNKFDYTKANDGSHLWLVTAFEQSDEQPNKVNFFIAWAKFKCDDDSSDVLAAELIRRKYIGYEEKSNAFKYLSN